MRDVTNHELLAMSVNITASLADFDVRVTGTHGKQKRRRAEVEDDEVKSRRQDIARGLVSMSEIRRIQDVLYRQSR